MASLKEIKRRVSSIKSIWKITSAMRKIASAKLHRAQSAVAAARLYEQQLQDILSSLSIDERTKESPYTDTKREVKRVAIVPFSSNSSLCGAFNTNVLRKLNTTIQTRYKNLDKSYILIFPVGRRIHDAALRAGYTVQGNFQKMAEKPNYTDAAALAHQLLELFSSHQVDCVELIYNRYKSMAVQISTAEVFLPFAPQKSALPSTGTSLSTGTSPSPSAPASQNASALPSNTRGWETFPDYIVEPSRDELIAVLFPKILKLKLFSTLLDSIAAEHAARTVAMQLATDNAEGMINELTLLYNKSRQQSITNELLDILGGSTR